MSGLVISAGTTQADTDIDRKIDALRAAAHGSVVEFPAREPPPAPPAVDATALRRLSDLLLLPAAMLHPQERAFAVDMIHTALDGADVEDRSQLARRLARAGPIAPSLVARLAHDRDLGVARPLLRHGASMADHDLIAVIRDGGVERAYQIACRAPLNADVAGEIAANADGAAVYAALRNTAAVLTPESIARIAVRARTDPSLCEPLLKRPEMTPACALDLFWQVGRDLREYVLGRFLADAATVRRILDGEAGSPPLPATAAPADGQGIQGAIMVIADNMARGRLDEARADLAPLAGVSGATARRIVHDHGGEAFAVAMKAAGARRSTFASVVALWQTAGRTVFEASGSLDELLVLFERLSVGQATMAMTYWDWREAGSGPYAASRTRESIGEEM
jgi:uncharacterized protein (DUF2336 family)